MAAHAARRCSRAVLPARIRAASCRDPRTTRGRARVAGTVSSTCEWKAAPAGKWRSIAAGCRSASSAQAKRERPASAKDEAGVLHRGAARARVAAVPVGARADGPAAAQARPGARRRAAERRRAATDPRAPRRHPAERESRRAAGRRRPAAPAQPRGRFEQPAPTSAGAIPAAAHSRGEDRHRRQHRRRRLVRLARRRRARRPRKTVPSTLTKQATARAPVSASTAPRRRRAAAAGPPPATGARARTGRGRSATR